jgi:hypothetical protein
VALAGVSFTIDAWIYSTGFSNTQEHIILSLCPSPIIYYCLYLSIHVSSGNYSLYFGFFGDDCQGNTYVSANEWIHVAFVFDVNSLTQSIYINENLDASRTAEGSFQASSGNLTTGGVPSMILFFDTNYFQVRF